MTIEESVFYGYKAVDENLKKYGTYRKEGYDVEGTICDGQFHVSLRIEKSEARGRITDTDTGDEFSMTRLTTQSSAFIGELKQAYVDFLTGIRENCFEKVLFPAEQSNRIARLIKEKYGITPDFPWSTDPYYGVFRVTHNGVWFGLIMDLPANKLAPDTPPKSVINVRPQEEDIERYRVLDGIYPGWHMNKKYWLSVSLDETFADDFIMEIIDGSYRRAYEKKKTRTTPIRNNGEKR